MEFKNALYKVKPKVHRNEIHTQAEKLPGGITDLDTSLQMDLVRFSSEWGNAMHLKRGLKWCKQLKSVKHF
jgi:hypothetical protein